MTDDNKRYDVFNRTWWIRNANWPGGREPGAGRKTYMARNVSWEEARAICKKYNDTHDPGFLSRKAEFEETTASYRRGVQPCQHEYGMLDVCRNCGEAK